jgi:hypothetical protein
MTFCWVITMIGACLGTLVLVLGFASAKGAPQEAASAALAVALAVIPYVFTRAVEGIQRENRESREMEKIEGDRL